MTYNPKVQQKVIVQFGNKRDVPYLFRNGYRYYVKEDYIMIEDPDLSIPSFSDLKGKEEYLYEKFSEIFKDQYGNEREEAWLIKDKERQEYSCLDEEMLPMMSLVAQNNIMIYLVDTSKFNKLSEMKRILLGFASKIDIINMNNIPMNKTIELMKNKNGLQTKIVSFIKNADLYLDNFEYVEMENIKVDINRTTGDIKVFKYSCL